MHFNNQPPQLELPSFEKEDDLTFSRNSFKPCKFDLDNIRIKHHGDGLYPPA